jgi:hypothetical protein
MGRAFASELRMEGGMAYDAQVRKDNIISALTRARRKILKVAQTLPPRSRVRSSWACGRPGS